MFISSAKITTISHNSFGKSAIIPTMNNLTQNERQLFILKLLADSNNVLYTEHLARKFNVTAKTLRADIRRLDQLGLITRVRGGIQAKVGLNLDFQEIQTLLLRELDSTVVQIYGEHIKKNLLHKNKVLIFGAFNIDISVKINDFPKLGETILSQSSQYMIGGKGINQALAMAANDTPVTYVGKIGRDQFYDYAKKYLNSNHLIKDIIFESIESPTGLAIVLVREDGEKEIIVNQGANTQIKAEEIYRIEEEIKGAEWISLQMENNLEAVFTVIRIAQQYQCKIVLDPTPFVPEILDILTELYLLTPNRQEAEQLTGISINDDTTAKQAIAMLHKMGVPNVVLTLGAQGAIASVQGKMRKFNAYKAVVNDKSGVGDAFNGALLTRLAAGDDLFTATDYAGAYAALCVERFGAANMPKGRLTELKFNQH
ncbi:ribokinase [Cricetibacter osteomyelitidis]|uniref:Ribokinase n=1 Tax=Cricetibacter osteomyelitidis TaxID=1521931 RepID=A0A4R2T2U3_9PAST|nr:ribokinase [Cricetibacter osteomyelitidis]TCP96285.1 ribokinase [Cricetibacter osteomyelitidis]